jgi:hypothetical protein
MSRCSVARRLDDLKGCWARCKTTTYACSVRTGPAHFALGTVASVAVYVGRSRSLREKHLVWHRGSS